MPSIEYYIDITRRFIEQYLPHCTTVFLAGSFVRGEGTSTSDLDLVILREHPDVPYRESYIFENYPIEAFVHNPTSLKKFFISDCERKTPSLPYMCLEGVVIKDTKNIAESIKQEAQTLIEKGPSPLTPDDIEAYRYSITDLLEDLKGSQRTIEDYFIVPNLFEKLIRFYLLYHRQWIGHGKWVFRYLKLFDPPKAQKVEQVLDEYYQSQNATGIILLTESWLSEMGGLLFEGYKSLAPRD